MLCYEHFSVEMDEMNNGMHQTTRDSDFESARNIVHEIYMHREEVLLLLTKSQGSSMEEHARQYSGSDGCTQCIYM